jgi:hypothetical protein
MIEGVSMKGKWVAMVVCLGVAVAAREVAAATPKEAVGFRGTVTGTVKSARPDGMSFVLKVLTAEPDEKLNTAKNPAGMVGKEIMLGVRMPRKDGKPYPSAEDVAYIKTLKPGVTIKVKIFAVNADPTVLRIQGPGEEVGAGAEKEK